MMIDEAKIRRRLANNLRKAREAKGISLEELSEKTGLCVNTVHRAEVGLITPRGINLYCIAKVLEVSIDSLFEGGVK